MRRFIVTGTQRTGSATIASLLGSHEGVACGWEWSHKVSWLQRVEACRRALHGDFALLCEPHRQQILAEISPASLWLGYRGLFRANDKWTLSPSIAPSLWLDRFHETLRWWQSEPAIHVVHMIRTDNLAWLRSKFGAKELGTFGAGQTYREDVSVHLPIRASLKRLEMKLWLDQRLGELRHSNPYHVIRYEDLLTDMEGVTRAAQQFLGLEPQPVPPEQVRPRQSAGIPVEQHIQNYEELRAALERAALLTTPFNR
jgi:Sulfotransferase family